MAGKDPDALGVIGTGLPVAGNGLMGGLPGGMPGGLPGGMPGGLPGGMHMHGGLPGGGLPGNGLPSTGLPGNGQPSLTLGPSGALPGQMPMATAGVPMYGSPEYPQGMAMQPTLTNSITNGVGPGGQALAPYQGGADTGAGGLMRGQSVSNLQHAHTRHNHHHAAGGDSSYQAQILASIQQMQATMKYMHDEQLRFGESLQEQLREHRENGEQQQQWLEQRLNAVERRCEKVERSSDRLCAQVASVDFDEILMNTKKALNSSQAYVSRSSGFDDSEAGSPGYRAPVRAAGDSKKLEHKVDKLADEVKQLVQQGEETANARQLLWKIDLAVRQMKQGSASTEQMMGSMIKLLVGVDDKVASMGQRRNGRGSVESPVRHPMGDSTLGSNIPMETTMMFDADATVNSRLAGNPRGGPGQGATPLRAAADPAQDAKDGSNSGNSSNAPPRRAQPPTVGIVGPAAAAQRANVARARAKAGHATEAQ
jgi:hypothetical protein